MRPLRDSSAILYRIYNALWYPVLPFALIASGGRNRNLRRNRLGYLELDTAASDPTGTCVWVHAASVGEIEAIRPVIIRLLRKRPELQIVLTTMTVAGRDAARRRIPGLAGYQLAPLDFAPAVRSFLREVRPSLVLIVETELWPNFLIEGNRVGARIAIVNARLSARSMRHYKWARGLIAHALGKADRIFAQTAEDAQRFKLLGACFDKIIVTGNTKFGLTPDEGVLRPVLAEFARDRAILIAGSTGPGEEPTVLDAYRRLVVRYPPLALIIAPRHLDRVPEIEKYLQAAAISFARASALGSSTDATRDDSVLLLDTMGELRGLYRRAAIAFVGGSLLPGRGGQSLAEPALASVPVLFGPYYESQLEIAQALIASSGGKVVKDSAEIEQACVAWLSDDGAGRAAGQSARQAIERVGSGDAITANYLMQLLDANEPPVKN